MTYTVPPGRYSDTSADFIQAYIDQSIQDLVGASPESLNTLQELADALGDNPDAITDLVAALDAEIARATAAEAAINQSIADQETLDAAARAELQVAIDAEVAASAAYDIIQDNRMSVLELLNDINKKELNYITLVGTAGPAPGQVGVNSFTPSGISMIVLPKTDADGKTIAAGDFLEGDRIGLKQDNGAAGIFFVEDAFSFGDHIRINVDDASTILGAGGDLAFVENDPINAVFEDTSVTRAAATAGFTAAADARAVLQGLIDALEARADALEADPTTQTLVDAGDAATLASANAYTDGEITSLINGAPGVLDTLKELSDSLGGDADFVTTINASIAAVQADVDQNEIDSDAAESALSGRLDVLESDPTTATAVAAVQADVDQNEIDSDAADSALSGRLDVLEADPTTATAVAAVQADVDQNEIDSDAADAALSGRLDTLEADPTTQTAVDAKLNIANPAATGDLTVDTEARLEFDSNITKLHNDLRGTRLDIGNNITVYPAAAGGRFEIEGGLYIRLSDLEEHNNDIDAAAAGIVVGGVYYDSNGHLKIRRS